MVNSCSGVTEQSTNEKHRKRPQTVNPAASKESVKTAEDRTGERDNQTKILITGDDVLIEYVNRLVSGLKKLMTTENNKDIEQVLEKFIGYYVWHTPDLKLSKPSASVSQRLEARLQEMRDRRKRLVKSVYK